MRLTDRLTARVGPFLEPGEEVRQVFMARSGLPPEKRTVNPMTVLRNANNHIIAVTNRGVVVLDASLWRSTVPTGLHRRLRRRVQLGRPVGLWADLTLDQTYYVHKRFHDEVRAAG